MLDIKISAVSRAILKPVYQFGIPNSDPPNYQINLSKNRKLTLHTLVPQCVEPQEGCFELLRMQNSQNFLGLCSWTPLRLLSCKTVFLAMLVKKTVPPKIAGYGTENVPPPFDLTKILKSYHKRNDTRKFLEK